MAAPLVTPREKWIEEGLRALGAGGPHAVRIEALARVLGVSKGGFYGQFAGRRELLEEMLDTWERLVVDEVIAQVDGGGGDARTKLGRLSALASSGGPPLMSIEVAIRDWARRDKTIAERLRRVDNRRMEYLRALFSDVTDDADDVEARSRLAMSLFVASPLIAADPVREPTKTLSAALAHLLT